MNTDEREERLRQIRERHRLALFAYKGDKPPIAVSDIDFLLSLLDSQTPTRPAHRNYECMTTIADETPMRQLCVVHLQSTADALDVRQETECPHGTAFNSEATLRRRIAVELQSLTLDHEEKQ